MNRMNQTPPQKKKWPKYCFLAALALLVFAGLIYFFYAQSISREFDYAKDYYGETFDEVYALGEVDSSLAEPLLRQAKTAMQNVGTADDFGALSRYCVDPSDYPGAASAKAKLEALVTEVDGSSGYVWVAYSRTIYDAQGTPLAEIGTADARRITRWTVEKLDGVWTITEISEP